MREPRGALGDFITWVLVPVAVSTLVFEALIWFRDTGRFDQSWPVAFIATGVIGFFSVFQYLVYRGRIRPGVWRDFL
ncbi:MAG: hypothetical protein E6K14_02210 [Methanobacteriota archaeon]|nr:MAG: hypothetical protein E6K14_02210 [Euryarchaeota archaeon]